MKSRNKKWKYQNKARKEKGGKKYSIFNSSSSSSEFSSIMFTASPSSLSSVLILIKCENIVC